MNSKDSKKVLKFKDFDYEKESTTEAMYKADENGEIVKQDYEFYKDSYPEKFRYTVDSEDTDVLYKECDKVWILKHNDEIIATFSGKLDENNIRESIEVIKSNSNENGKEII